MTALKSEYIISDSVYHYCTMCFYEDLRALITLTINQKLFCVQPFHLPQANALNDYLNLSCRYDQ